MGKLKLIKLINLLKLLILIYGCTAEEISINDDIEIDNQIQETISPELITELSSERIVGEKHLRYAESPYLLTNDLDIERGAKLLIEPGVKIYFAPMIGINIRGSIVAIGTPEQRITFTVQPHVDYINDISTDRTVVGARLVDGPSPIAGRLQLYHHGKWRSVCTNSRNWTIADYEITCRQMGYQGGRFWNWMERLYNYDPRLLYEEPNCRGTETSLIECAWQTKQLGSGVCDYHNDIGIQCLPLHETAMSNWRGLLFDHAPAQPQLATDRTVYESISLSELKYVDILKSGSGRGHTVNAAIEVIGTPPRLEYVTIDHSAYTGINVTRSESAFTFKQVTVRRSKGIGLFVNSSYGLAQLIDCNINENGADGIRYVGHDLRADERTDRSGIHDFCTFPTTAGQTYPIAVSLQQSQYAGAEKECSKYFFTRPGYVITVYFVNFIVRTNDTADIQVYDGSSIGDRLLGSWNIRNLTRPQSLTSTREKIFVRFRANPRSEILGFLRITAGPFKAYDLNVTSSFISDNGGRGIAIDNLRSDLHVHHSTVSNNGHVAGIHVTSGSGDVNVTHSHISFNNGDGINITYFGGNRNISRSSISSNVGYGVAVWLNQTVAIDRLEYLTFNQTTVIEYTDFVKNLEIGILHGNSSSDFWVNITGNHFNESQSNSVDIQTCWFRTENDQRLRLQIGHNDFEYDNKIGIIISPALNVIGKIEYNHFRYGKYGAILIRNKPWEEFRILPVQLYVQHNQFYENKGIYVASLGLSPYTDKDQQWLLFTRNFVRLNKISEPFDSTEDSGEGMMGENRLSPRSHVAAPIVISSSNVDVFRNIIQNLDSRYEVGSQLADQSQILNVTYNWLGHSEEEQIFNRLFHRKDRFDLAKIEYIPYLLHNSNPGANTIISFSTYVPRFYTNGIDRVGGEVDGQELLPIGTYTVDRDINIRPGGKLTLQPGVVLNFLPSVGMMVTGKLEARGRNPDDIFFTLKRAPVMAFDNETIADDGGDGADMENMDIETEMILDSNEQPKIPIRLLGGTNEHEGRLQLYLDGRWGTVCDYGWTIINAALACHQMGLALNPYDWQLLRSEVPTAGTTEEVIVSNVRCTEHDIDITKCRAEKLQNGEFENSCNHEYDVGLRCYEGAWAGLRFGVLAERVDLQYVTIEKAGLFDYATNTFKSAVQMDFARHNLENVRIVNNLHDGLGIIYSDIYGGSINSVKNCEFSNNHGNGISLKQLGLRVQGSIIKDNLGSGIMHNPVISDIEQRELAGWFHMAPDFNVHDSDYQPIILPKDDVHLIELDIYKIRHVLTGKYVSEESIERSVSIRCQPGYVIAIQLLNPIQNGSTENIWIHDSQTGNLKSDTFEVKRDLSVFPVTSSSYGIILSYKSGSNAFGGVVLVISTSPAPVQEIKNRIVKGPHPTLHITSTKIQKNARGISAIYYNRYLGERGEHYLRKANESIKIIQCEISHNVEEAVFVYAPFWDIHTSNISEISIHLNNTLITHNGRGIRQYSKDLRSSNNLFHYVLQDTTVEGNRNGGMEISLPYVWQYNENFTHSIYLGNNTWTRNTQFGIEISGHYAAINITGNLFSENECEAGLVAIQGMEKKMKIDNNRFLQNNGRFMIEFRTESLSEILGEVNALFIFNEMKNNKYEVTSTHRSMGYRTGILHGVDTIGNPIVKRQYPNEPTCLIGLNGVQKVKINRNLFISNSLNYDLIAGVKSARLGNFLDATENWWDSIEPDYILKRIFDFDDWNNHAEVQFRPFLLENSIDASISISFSETPQPQLQKLGGRIFQDITLTRELSPYILNTDLTIMPGITVTINPGVELEFAPNVGILVLGTLNARGFADGEIVMRLQKTVRKLESKMIQKRMVENLAVYDTIRLCTERNCTFDENEISPIHQGFLEYFNHTTVQWVPICDRRFTERNAQVVCRELGYDPLDVYFGHDKRIEYHTNSLTRIWSWVQPLECRGDEKHFHECAERLNGQLYGRRHECKWDDKFVFVNCNGDGDLRQYWGGIRFANSEFEQNIYEHRLHDITSHGSVSVAQSQLSYVRIENAGMLHNEKSPAIQVILQNPRISAVTIVNSAHHAVNLVSPKDAMHLQFLKIENTLGQGINAISLTGEGRESDESSFSPIKSLELPYNLFSLIDICDTSKVITLEERVILYYKYDNIPVNCVKIFNSAYRVKPIGFRLLQSNLFNHSKEYGRRDTIHLYDGDIYNISAKYIDSIEADSSNEKRLFRTVGPILSVRLIASGAPSTHGFFAEIVTLPISAIGFNRDAQHNVSNSEISGAVGGAIFYTTAGEVSPILTMENNRIQKNCRQLYGNFSTCDATVKIDVQNMQTFHFRNNLIQSNQGGLYLRADSRGSATSLRAWIHHNLFTNNTNRPSLYVEGRQSSPYQEVIIYKNYFTQNRAAYADVIVLKQVVSNFTYNYVHSNRGGRIVDISGFDKVRLPIYQTTSHNGFYDNVATDWRGRATIVAGTAGQSYVDNIFYNPDNDYEMITVNRSIFEFQFWNSTVDLWKTKIVASHNFWNYNETLAVSGRIRDRSDDPQLLEVQFMPYYMNNQTILDGKCPPGWSLLLDTCYMYVGAPMTFHEARDFCRSDNASLPFIRGDATLLWLYLQRQMIHLRFPEKVWVQDLNYLEQCTSFIYRNVEIEPCDTKRGFICEIDPKVIIDPLSWRADIVAISVITAFALAIILLCIFGFCWYRKSRHRHVQRLQRRNSIRQSLRSLNTIDAQGSIRRRNYNVSRSTDTLTKSTVTDYKKMMSNGSIDSMDKSVLSSDTSYDMYEGHQNPYSTNPTATTFTGNNNVQNHSKYNEAMSSGNNQKQFRRMQQQQQPPAPASEIINKSYGLPDYNTTTTAAATNPSTPQGGGFELSYKNEGFRDNSTYAPSTRNNSMSTNINEDTPIIHQIDPDDGSSDYYGNSNTLPIRSRGENLSFLSELKHKLPEYELLPNQSPSHSSFIPKHQQQQQQQKPIVRPPAAPPQQNKINEYQIPEIRRPDPYLNNNPLSEVKRPDSYYTAMKTVRDSRPIKGGPSKLSSHQPSSVSSAASSSLSSQYPYEHEQQSYTSHQPSQYPSQRPKTVYEASDNDHRGGGGGGGGVGGGPTSNSYSRSKSEALLETNFDEEILPTKQLTSDSRSYSQPLETAM